MISEREEVTPILFFFRDRIQVGEHELEITANGRAVLTPGLPGKWWMFGVELGGIEASGATPTEAHLSFLEAFRECIIDMNDGTKSCVDLCNEIISFFSETCGHWEERWGSYDACITVCRLGP